MRAVSLPSGGVLNVGAAPFADSKALWQALLDELRGVAFNGEELQSILKELFCIGFSSQVLEAHIWNCAKKCTIQPSAINSPEKVVPDYFEAVERRQDFVTVCSEVVKENVTPFVKALFAEWQGQYSMIGSILKSSQETTT